ncbi:hypothetical protein [Pantoea ananatis]|uniref:hypothetical protein n=1 Tax=Pantoea ananas TaxID=553 RepID=UPI004037B6DC
MRKGPLVQCPPGKRWCRVWSGLVWSGLVWSGLVWSGLVWSGLVLTLPDSHEIAQYCPEYV